MKNLFKITMATFLICLEVTNTSLYAKAQEVKPQDVGKISFVGEITEDGCFKTQSIDDETGLVDAGLPKENWSEGNELNAFQVMLNIQSTLWETSGWVGESYVEEVCEGTGTSTIIKSHVKYLTSSWAKANSYSWSKSNTATWSYGGGTSVDIAENVRLALNLSRSRTTNYSVTITLPADPKRDSKLSFFSDYHKQNYKYTKKVDGLTVATKSGYISTPTETTYLDISYKN